MAHAKVAITYGQQAGKGSHVKNSVTHGFKALRPLWSAIYARPLQAIVITRWSAVHLVVFPACSLLLLVFRRHVRVGPLFIVLSALMT